MRTRNSSEKRKWRGEIKTLKGELKQREEVNPVHGICMYNVAYIYMYLCFIYMYMYMYSVRADGICKYLVGTHYVYTILE